MLIFLKCLLFMSPLLAVWTLGIVVISMFLLTIACWDHNIKDEVALVEAFAPLPCPLHVLDSMLTQMLKRVPCPCRSCHSWKLHWLMLLCNLTSDDFILIDAVVQFDRCACF